MTELPAASGTYVLVMPLEDAVSFEVGRLGPVTLDAGVYGYVGSARGPGGLRARVGRHLRPDKPVHWHIDALTTRIPVRTVWWQESPDRLECDWVQRLMALSGVCIPVPGFGSSDCSCPAHLIKLETKILSRAWEALGRW